MKNNQKTIAVLTALSTLIATTGCSEEQIRQEYENEKEKVYEDMDAKLEQQKEEIVKSILAELQGTTDPVVTTTYDAQVTAGTTNGTSLQLTTISTAKQTTTQATTEKEAAITMATHEQRGPIPEPKTTTTVTTTVAPQNTIIEPKFKEKEAESKISYEGYNVILGGQYRVQGNNTTVGGSGEGLYSILYNYYGKYNEKLSKIIMEKNKLKETFVSENTKLDLPTVILYKGNSIAEVSHETRISEEEIAQYDEGKDKNYIVKVLYGNEFTDTYAQKNIVITDAVILADRIVRVDENAYLLLHDTGKGHNVVDYMELKGKQATVTTFAYDVADISKNGVTCMNESYKASLKAGKRNPDDYNTEICKFRDLFVYSNNDEMIVSTKQLEAIPQGYNYIETIGGYQKTK